MTALYPVLPSATFWVILGIIVMAALYPILPSVTQRYSVIPSSTFLGISGYYCDDCALPSVTQCYLVLLSATQATAQPPPPRTTPHSTGIKNNTRESDREDGENREDREDRVDGKIGRMGQEWCALIKRSAPIKRSVPIAPIKR